MKLAGKLHILALWIMIAYKNDEITAKMMRGVLRQQQLRRRGVEIGNLPSRAGSHAQY